MTIEKAIEDIPDIDAFCKTVCNYCGHDYYCHNYCYDLQKAKGLDYDRIVKCYAKHDGDLFKVMRYIKNTKVNRKKGGY